MFKILHMMNVNQLNSSKYTVKMHLYDGQEPENASCEIKIIIIFT